MVIKYMLNLLLQKRVKLSALSLTVCTSVENSMYVYTSVTETSVFAVRLPPRPFIRHVLPFHSVLYARNVGLIPCSIKQS